MKILLFAASLCAFAQVGSSPINCSVLRSAADPNEFLVRVNMVPRGPQSGLAACEYVILDTTVFSRRNPIGQLIVSANPTAPPVSYSTMFQVEFVSSNQKELPAPPPNPPTLYDGQPVWCALPADRQSFSTVTKIIATDSQIQRMLPAIVIEVREGIGSSRLITQNLAWPPGRPRYNANHPACNGGPGYVFPDGADMFYQDNQDTSRSPLLQLLIVSLLPTP